MKPTLAFILCATLISCSNNVERSNILNNQAAELINAGQYQLALEQLQKAIDINRDNYIAYNNSATAKKKLGYAFEEIESDLLHALKVEPNYRAGLESIMSVYFNHGQHDKVVKYAEHYLQFYQLDADRMNIVGESYRVIKDFDKALDFLKTSIELDSTQWGANLNLAEVYMNIDDYQAALFYLRRAKKYNKNYSGIFNELGICHYVQGRVDSALVYVNHALNLKSDSVYMINKATYLVKLDSISSGCEWFRKAETMGRSVEEIYGNESEQSKLKRRYCK